MDVFAVMLAGALTRSADPVIAESVSAVCVGDSRHPVPQSLRISLTATNVVRSLEKYATCRDSLITAKKLAKSHRLKARGFRCTATRTDPEGFTDRYVCDLQTAKRTLVRLEFDLILD